MRTFRVGAALLLTGCSTAIPSTQAASALKPIDRSALQSLVDTTTKELLVPGAVVLLRTPQGDFTATSGTTQRHTTNPPSADTYFRIASNTKTITAAVILQLAQDGKLRLSDPVSKYVPGVPPAELLAMAFARPPNFRPGTKYEYNNTNYVLLGLIIEKVDGRPLGRAMQHRLFEPLGMHHTMLPASASTSIPEPYSHGYLYGSASNALIGTAKYSAEEKAAATAGTLQPTDYTGVNHSFAWAAGGVISTANDLATWIQALATGRVLDAEYQRRWLDSPQPEDPSRPQQKYGYGISEFSWGPNTIYFHGGETVGYKSKISCDPTHQVTLIVWTNLVVSLDGLQPANTLWLKVLDQIDMVSPLQPRPSPAAAR